MRSVAAPELVSVTVCAGLLLPCEVVAKVRLPGDRVTEGRAETPVPLREIDWGLPGALSIATRLAWRDPAALGGKTMLMVQVTFGVRTVGTEQLGVATKSERFTPATLTDVRLRPCPPV